MKIGAMNNPRNSIVDEIRLFGEYGFDYVDLTVEYPQATPEKIDAGMREIQDALSSHSLGLVGHMPWFLNIIHPYESVRKAVFAECERVFDTCSRLGIEHVTIHPDFMKLKREQKDVLAETADSLRTITKSAKDRGLTLCFENFEEDYFTAEQLRRLISSVDGLMFTLDIGHAHMKARKTDTVVHMIKELKPYLRHVHLHDNHGWKDEHLPLGVGTVDVPRVTQALKEAGYDGTITLEIHAEDREYLAISKRKLQAAWG